MGNSNLNSVSDDDIKEVAKNLGVDLDDDTNEKTEEESGSEKKTDTETTEGGRSGESEKTEDRIKRLEEQVKGSTKEFQEKYKPLEENVKKLEQLTGKSFDVLIQDYEKGQDKTDDKKGDKSKKDAPGDVDNEVSFEVASLKERLDSLEKKTSEYAEKDKLSAKKKVETFREKYGMSVDDYEGKISPLLPAISEMKQPSGDPYTLEDGLEIAYIVANRGQIEKLVEKKAMIKQKESELSFTPSGYKESVSGSGDKSEYSEQQKEIARKFHIDLEKESDKS